MGLMGRITTKGGTDYGDSDRAAGGGHGEIQH